MKFFHTLFIFTFIIIVNASAQDEDLRMKKQLDRMNLNYEVTSSGNFKLLFELEDKRTQIVFINSETRMHKDAEVREISSPAKFVTKADELSHEQLWMLLAFNSQTTLGAWQLEPASDGWGLHFTVKVPAMMPENRLMMYMVLVATAADEMEKAFSDEDLF